MGDEIIVKPKAPYGRMSLSKEKKAMLLESAALAYVQMEHGDYKFAPGTTRGNRGPDGKFMPNKREVMRRAGFSVKGQDHFTEYLQDNDEFWHLVNVYRIRYNDPMFKKDKESMLFEAVGNESLRHLYERVYYQGHSLTTEQHIKIVKLILDAGVALNKMEKHAESKSEKLIKSIKDPEVREKVLGNYKAKLQEELKAIEGIGSSEVSDVPVHSPRVESGDEQERDDEHGAG